MSNAPRTSHTSTQEEGKTMTATTTAPAVEVIYTAPTGNRTAGRIHRATCKHIPKGATQLSPADAGVEALGAATRATCCSVRQAEVERALLEALAAEATAPDDDPVPDEERYPNDPDPADNYGTPSTDTRAGDDVTDPEAAAVPKAVRHGALRDLVEAYLREHPGTAFTAYQIGKDLQRSSGAVTNALATLTELGVATHVSDSPRTYQLGTEVAK